MQLFRMILIGAMSSCPGGKGSPQRFLRLQARGIPTLPLQLQLLLLLLLLLLLILLLLLLLTRILLKTLDLFLAGYEGSSGSTSRLKWFGGLV